ncbi:MAG: phospholipase D family protein [Phycisphaerales bacterium]|nr:phospholipase D family protein [Phycisphaerales bacterium]
MDDVQLNSGIAEHQPVSLLRDEWRSVFDRLVSSATSRLTICSPFFSEEGARAVEASRRGKARLDDESLVLTDLSPRSVCTGATDPMAVRRVARCLPGSRLVHLPRLHAKVYIADQREAVVTSANLTAGGLRINSEYGVLLGDESLIRAIDRDVREYASLGAEMPDDALVRFCAVAAEAKRLYDAQMSAASRKTSRRLIASLAAANEELLRARLGGGAVHTVFARTIEYLLRAHGAMTTASLHTHIQRVHPDLCDDAVDRVIDGHSFGKKWKHAVRTAQQQLKKRGAVRLANGRWSLVANEDR